MKYKPSLKMNKRANNTERKRERERTRRERRDGSTQVRDFKETPIDKNISKHKQDGG